ncbi:PaaI family thioesterase [Comamonas antarctica]|uniref:PaaI family thioesterase n=1 Tax=Comamonas antarctica TaxID=2743470 RepID=A0A6N1X7Q0_9BURK|nr:PaaI family thioesterase [Comamonas antarctica]QKV55419.1 PaaI family thioesterase [Comamonas antarctica]
MPSAPTPDSRELPPGFLPSPALSPFMALWGQVYLRIDSPQSRVLGLWVQEQHLNHQEAMHGGMVASLADNAMGSLSAHASGGPIATVHLSVDYLARVPQGRWLEVHSRLDKLGGKMLFTSCEGRIDAELVFKASAVFAPIRRAAPAPAP